MLDMLVSHGDCVGGTNSEETCLGSCVEAIDDDFTSGGVDETKSIKRARGGSAGWFAP